MKRLFLSLLTCSLFVTLLALSAQNRYHSRMTQDGTLFFFMPHKITKLEGIKRFEYDMTMLNWTDSTTINFTFESSSLLLPENLKIISGNNSFVCHSYSPLFADIKKHHYEIRITSKFPNSEVLSFIENPNPPIFSFTQNNQLKTASYKQAAWNSDRKKLYDIYQLYILSK